MGQIIGSAAKPKRCNLSKLSQLGTPAAGEHILVSYDNSMTANGQGNFDRYIIGDGRTAATELELKYLDDSTRPYIVEEVNKAVADIQPIEITGDVTNAPDEEDLTSENQGGTDVLKFKDKAYNSALYSGLGRTYLRKNIVTLEGTGKNVLTQAMVNTANTIYHIQYDYDLNGQTITLPAGCVLEFDGGIIDGGELVLNNTHIIGDIAFGENIILSGNTSQVLKTSIIKGTEAGVKVNKLYAVANSVEINEDLSSTTTILLRANKTLEGGSHTLSHNSSAPAILVSGMSKLQNLRINTNVNDDTPIIKMDTSGSTGNQNVLNNGVISNITITASVIGKGIGIYAEGGIAAHGTLCFHKFERLSLNYLNYGIRLEVGNVFDTTSWMNGNVFDGISIYSCAYGIYLNSATGHNIDGNKFSNVEIQWTNTYGVRNIYMNGCTYNTLDVMHWDCSDEQAFLLTDCTQGNLIISNKKYLNTNNKFIDGKVEVNRGNLCTIARYNNYLNTIINEKPYFNGRQTNLLENAHLFYDISTIADANITIVGDVEDVFKNNYDSIGISNTGQATGVGRVKIDFGEEVTFDDFCIVWAAAQYPNEVRIYSVAGQTETLLFTKTNINKQTIPIIRTFETNAMKAPVGNALIFEFTLEAGKIAKIQHLTAAGYSQHAFVEVGTPMGTDLSFDEYKGIVLKSKNGTLYKISVSDAGVVSTKEWHENSVDVIYDSDVVLSNDDARKGTSFTTTLSSNYGIGSVTIYMNGEDVTSSCWNSSTSTITIANVTGTIIIDCILNKVITFADQAVKNLCVTNWGGHYVQNEITEYEAAQVTTLGEVFKSNTTILSFNELKYFVGLTTLRESLRGCTSLQSITIPNAKGVTSLFWAFLNCRSLTGTLDLTPLNDSPITTMESALRKLGGLSKIILPKCSSVTNMSYALCKDPADANTLTEVDSTLFSWDSVANINNCFGSLDGLTTITGGLRGLKISVDLSSCPITHNNAIEILESLGTTSGATITFKSTTLESLTEEEKQIAIDKGWTIA